MGQICGYPGPAPVARRVAVRLPVFPSSVSPSISSTHHTTQRAASRRFCGNAARSALAREPVPPGAETPLGLRHAGAEDIGLGV